MRCSDVRLNFSEKDRGKVWKEHMERIMNEENEWDQNVKAELVEGPEDSVGRSGEGDKGNERGKGCWTLGNKC